MKIEAHQTSSIDTRYQITQMLSEGVAVQNSSGQIVFVNKSLERLLGYRAEELVGLDWTSLFLGPEHSQTKVTQTALPSEFANHHETRLQRKDGTTVPVLVNTNLLFDDGHCSGVLMAFTDLSEQDYLKAKLEYFEKIAVMGQQAASVVHELNNALTIIFLQTQLMNRKLQLSPHLGGNLAIIQEQARRMTRMMNGLRTSESHQFDPKQTDVNVLIERTIDLFGDQLQRDGIRVITQLDARLPLIQADADQIQRVFFNLVKNAYQAILTSDQEGTLAIITEFSPSNNGKSDQIRIRFVDTGVGIPADVISHIFEPFFTTKDVGQGMGLGLSICEQIVQRHKGRIWAENNPKRGATFALELPVIPMDAEAADREATAVSEVFAMLRRPASKRPALMAYW